MSSSPKLYNRGYILLNASNFFYSLYSITFIFLPACLYRLGMREGEIGLLMATGTLVAVVLKPLYASIAGRGFRKTILVMGALLSAVSTIPWVFITTAGPLLYLFRMIQGVALSMFTAASFSHIAASAPPQRRAEAFGIFGLNFFLPASMGGWIGEWIIRRADYSGLFAVGIGVALFAAFFPLGMREPEVREHVSFRSLAVFLTRPFLAPDSAGYLFGVAYGTIFAFLPVYLLAVGNASIGTFVFIYALAVVLTRLLGRRLIDQLPRERTALVSLLLLCAGTMLIPFSGTGARLAVAGAAAGAGNGLIFPALSALLLDRSGSGSGGMAMAIFSGAFDLGVVTGAAVFGFVAQVFGFTAMFVAASAVVGGGTLGFFLLDPSFRKGARPSPGP